MNNLALKTHFVCFNEALQRHQLAYGLEIYNQRLDTGAALMGR